MQNLWSVMRPEAMLMSVGCAVGRDHVNLSGLCWHLMPCWYPAHDATEDHVRVCGPTAARVCVNTCVTAKGHEERRCWCPWAGCASVRVHTDLVASTVTWGHVDIHGPGCIRGLCLGSWSYCRWEPCSWSVLLLETVWRPMTPASTDCEVQGGSFSCDIDDWRWQWRGKK